MIDPTAAPDGDRSQTYSVPGENPLDAGDRLLLGDRDRLPRPDRQGARPARSAICSADAPATPSRSRPTCSTSTPAAAAKATTRATDEYGEGLTPEAMVRQARQMMRDYGFTDDQAEGRRARSRGRDRRRSRRCYAAFGDDVPLRIDPNCAWSVETSVEVGRALREELGGGGYLEDPCAGMDGMAAVRKALLAAGDRHAARQQRRGHVLRRSAGRGRAGRRADRAVRSALLGRRAPDPAPRAALPDVRPRPVDALEQPSRRLADGDDARRRGGAAPDLRLRHALPVAGRRRRESSPAAASASSNGCVGSPTSPASASISIRTPSRAAASATQRCPYRKRDDEAEMRKHVDPTWTRQLPRW